MGWEGAEGYLFNLDTDLCVAIVGGAGRCLPWSLRLMDDHFNVISSVWSLPGGVTCLNEVCTSAPRLSVLCGYTVWSFPGSVTCLSEVCNIAPHISVLCECTVWSLPGGVTCLSEV